MVQKCKKLEKAIAIAIEALEQRLEEEPYEGVVKDIYRRFKKALEIVETNGDLNKAVIIGACRAYCDSYTDYDNPMLDKISDVEEIMIELMEYDKPLKNR